MNLIVLTLNMYMMMRMSLLRLLKIINVLTVKASEKIENKSNNLINDVPRNWRIFHDHPRDQILGKTIDMLRARSLCNNIC